MVQRERGRDSSIVNISNINSSSFSDLRKRFLRSSEIEMPFLLYEKQQTWKRSGCEDKCMLGDHLWPPHRHTRHTHSAVILLLLLITYYRDDDDDDYITSHKRR